MAYPQQRVFLVPGLVTRRQASAYSADPCGSWGIYRKDAGGAGEEELLLGAGKSGLAPSSWSRDGRIFFTKAGTPKYMAVQVAKKMFSCCC